jgi:hypothetical protein
MIKTARRKSLPETANPVVTITNSVLMTDDETA